MKKLATAVALLATSSAVAMIVPTVASATPAAREYANCTALNHDYPHGVGRPGARDSTSGTPVTNFTRDRALYNANTKSDRDKDGIACEKA